MDTKQEMPAPSTGAAPFPVGQPAAARRRHHLFKHFRLGAVILVVCSLLKLALGRTEAGHWLHLQAYHWMHGVVSRAAPSGSQPLILVDISELKPFPAPPGSGSGLEFTPRDELEKLIRKLAAARPAALGVDIDFSPETNGFVAPGSFKLFDACLDVSQQGVPVFLGVRRMEALGPAAWLGAERYAPMAASISRPRGPVSRMISEYRFGESGPVLKSLGRALADASLARQAASRRQTLPLPLRWATHQVSETSPVKTVREFKVREFHVDFSRRSELQEGALPWATVLGLGTAEMADRFGGRMVLIGDTSKATVQDAAIVPGSDEPVAGVLVHACAALTLAGSAVFELAWWAGLLLSLVLSLAALTLIHCACLGYADRAPVTTVPLTMILTALLMALFLGLAWSLMRFARVMWLEVFAVCLVLLVHSSVEVLVASMHWAHLRRRPLTELLVTPPRHTNPKL